MAAIYLLHGGGKVLSTTARKEFRCGRFQLKHEDHALFVIALRDEFQVRTHKLRSQQKKKISTQGVFLKALSRVVANPDFDLKVLRSILLSIRYQPTEYKYYIHLNTLIRKQLKEAKIPGTRTLTAGPPDQC